MQPTSSPKAYYRRSDFTLYLIHTALTTRRGGATLLLHISCFRLLARLIFRRRTSPCQLENIRDVSRYYFEQGVTPVFDEFFIIVELYTHSNASPRFVKFPRLPPQNVLASISCQITESFIDMVGRRFMRIFLRLTSTTYRPYYGRKPVTSPPSAHCIVFTSFTQYQHDHFAR